MNSAPTGIVTHGPVPDGRCQNDEALRRSEERFRALVAATGQAVWSWVPGASVGDPTPAQRWWGDLTGQTIDEQTAGRNGWLDALHPDDRAAAATAWMRCLDTGTPYAVEYRVRDRAGDWRHVQARGVPISAPDGSVREWVGTLGDVTEQRRAERDLVRVVAESERQRRLFETTLSNTADFIYRFDLNGRFTYVNKALLDLWQKDASEALGKSFFDLDYPPDLAARLHRQILEVASTRQPLRDETPYTSAIGTRSYEYIFAPVLGTDGTVEAVAGSTRDITEHKRAQADLAASARFFHSSIDALASHIAVLDEDGVILAVNDAWRRFAEENRFVGPDHGVGARYLETCEVVTGLGTDGQIIAAGVDDVLRGREALFELEYPYHSPTEERWFVLRVTRFKPPGPVRVVVSHENVTQRKKSELALKDSDRRKDEFLATLAHELRNPLAPLRNGLQILRQSGDAAPKERAIVMMDRQVTQLVRLVDDLMDVSRITEGKLGLQIERVDLRTVIENTVEITRPEIERAGHELTAVLPEGPVYVDGDVTRMTQIVSNLLNNSAKYTHPGGHIRLTVGCEGVTAVVSVQDDGIGIPPAMLGQVFRMFTQVDRTLEKTTGGLGIGLALVKGLVKMHGGTIEARSEGEGRGSEFVVRLPGAVTGGADRAAGEDAGGTPAVRYRILVVDDNRDAAESLAEMLQLLGNEVETAHDGLQAVASAERFRPEIVLMDVGMPKLNGLEATKRIREQPWGRGIRIIALTGWGQEADRERSREAGCDGHLVKPVNLTDLEQLLVKFVPAPVDSLQPPTP